MPLVLAPLGTFETQKSAVVCFWGWARGQVVRAHGSRITSVLTQSACGESKADASDAAHIQCTARCASSTCLLNTEVKHDIFTQAHVHIERVGGDKAKVLIRRLAFQTCSNAGWGGASSRGRAAPGSSRWNARGGSSLALGRGGAWALRPGCAPDSGSGCPGLPRRRAKRGGTGRRLQSLSSRAHMWGFQKTTC